MVCIFGPAGQSIVVQFAASSYSVSEGAGEVVLNLTANGTSAVNYTVVVDTMDGSATGEPTIYVHLAFVLTEG